MAQAVIRQPLTTLYILKPIEDADAKYTYIQTDRQTDRQTKTTTKCEKQFLRK
jgi:hypothetical protein